MAGQPTPLHVVVIGTGIVGAACGLELLRDGHRVTLLDPGEPGGRGAASFGNGGWLSPASVVPMSMPGLWRKLPAMLFDPSGPLVIRPAALPRLLPWLLRFLLAGATVARVERTAAALATLLRDAPDRHARLAAEAGVGALIRRQGLLYAYPDRAAFEAEALAWRLRREAGLAWLELDADELRQREPALDRRYRFGVFAETGAHCTDPGALVAALAARAVAGGSELLRARATGFRIIAGRLLSVTLDGGGEIGCDRAVIAAGIASKALAREAGDRVSLESERGYHVVVSAADGSPPAGAPRIPVMPSDGKMANTPTRAGLRAAGQVELAAAERAPDWRRADLLAGHLRRTYPGLAVPERFGDDARWMGHRPSTPDGLPVIGPARSTADVVHAFGHGHVGLAAGPRTAALVADLIAGRIAAADLAAFRAGRFSRGG